MSGGVDSTVAAALMHKAVGQRLYCVFVDTGLLRKNEAQQARVALEKIGLRHLYFIDAEKKFLTALKDATDPEEKRKRIAKTFIQVFEQKASELKKRHGEINFLAQGTIYPDRIESAQPSKEASRIKSHHNVALPEKMRLRGIETVKEFYKDEVREVAGALGLPPEIQHRMPFPGPGLAVRVIGEATPEKIGVVREANAIVEEELVEGYRPWQCFAALLGKGTGVKGDVRIHGWIIAVRAVNSRDGMTADWARLPHDLLARIGSRIVNEVPGVNRVVYDITSKPPATIEWE